MKRIVNLFLLLFGMAIIYVLVFEMISVECIFKRLFHIRCVGCGLTRSFQAILKGEFLSAIEYNILGIPLFFFLFLIGIFLIVDIITNQWRTLHMLERILKKYRKLIITIIVLVMIINNISKV